jgi:putative ABC transport system substrate-binding protein
MSSPPSAIVTGSVRSHDRKTSKVIPRQTRRLLTEVFREKAGALLVFREPIFTADRQRIADFAATHRLPAIYGSQNFIEVGGLVVYSANFLDMLRRAAGYVDKILKGAKPADLPIEQPTKFEFVVNLKTAKALGLTIPPAVLVRADRVIE